MGEGQYKTLDELKVLKRDFDAKIELAEEVCTESQLIQLKRFVMDEIRDW